MLLFLFCLYPYPSFLNTSFFFFFAYGFIICSHPYIHGCAPPTQNSLVIFSQRNLGNATVSPEKRCLYVGHCSGSSVHRVLRTQCCVYLCSRQERGAGSGSKHSRLVCLWKPTFTSLLSEWLFSYWKCVLLVASGHSILNFDKVLVSVSLVLSQDFKTSVSKKLNCSSQFIPLITTRMFLHMIFRESIKHKWNRLGNECKRINSFELWLHNGNRLLWMNLCSEVMNSRANALPWVHLYYCITPESIDKVGFF